MRKLIAGKPYRPTKLSSKAEAVTTSIAEDICYAVTRGQWETAKHTLLGVTLHHMTGSAQIVSLINLFGHCQSYSQVLELETAMANQVMIQDNILPSNISPTNNKVCHVCVGIISIFLKRRHLVRERRIRRMG